MFFPLTPLTSSIQLLNYDQWGVLPFLLGHLLSFSPFTLQFSRSGPAPAPCERFGSSKHAKLLPGLSGQQILGGKAYPSCLVSVLC